MAFGRDSSQSGFTCTRFLAEKKLSFGFYCVKRKGHCNKEHAAVFFLTGILCNVSHVICVSCAERESVHILRVVKSVHITMVS